MTHKILIAGFGGQGILFLGKTLANLGLIQGKHVSWLPSYGPEMRGGTCNCNVIISDTEIDSPLIEKPSLLIVMNQPSYTKFKERVAMGGKVFVDSALVTSDEKYSIPATTIATQAGHKRMANMVVLGKLIKETNLATLEEVRKAFEVTIADGKADLVELNMSLVKEGYDGN